MVLNEFIANKLEGLRKEKQIGVYTLCNRAAISYERTAASARTAIRTSICGRC